MRPVFLYFFKSWQSLGLEHWFPNLSELLPKSR